MNIKLKNIFSNVPKLLPNELIEQLAMSKDCKIERIISPKLSTPKGEWYDQDKDEFVLVLKGSAKLKFKNQLVKMKKGDYILIPAHAKHRVEKTDKETIWLTVFY